MQVLTTGRQGCRSVTGSVTRSESMNWWRTQGLATDQKRRNVCFSGGGGDTSIGPQWRSGTGGGYTEVSPPLTLYAQYKDVLPVTSSCLAHMTRADWPSLLSRCEDSHLERLLFFNPARSSFLVLFNIVDARLRLSQNSNIHRNRISRVLTPPSKLLASHCILSHRILARGVD